MFSGDSSVAVPGLFCFGVALLGSSVPLSAIIKVDIKEDTKEETKEETKENTKEVRKQQAAQNNSSSKVK